MDNCLVVVRLSTASPLQRVSIVALMLSISLSYKRKMLDGKLTS